MVNGTRIGVRRRRGLMVIGRLGISLALFAAPAATADPVDPAAPEPAVVVDLTPADGVPHLPSPDNLPPGTTQAAPEGSNMSYLRYLWQAVHTPGVTMSDALLLIAQRPLGATSAELPVEPSAPASP
ncbi:MAG: dopamine receptor D4 [Actinomycetes bacterium]